MVKTVLHGMNVQWGKALWIRNRIVGPVQYL